MKYVIILIAITLMEGCGTGTRISKEILNEDSVVDGQTLRLEDGREIRLIGVDCAKSGEEALKAKRFVELGLKNKRNVKLQYDAVFSETENKDERGRLWAYVRIPLDHIEESKEWKETAFELLNRHGMVLNETLIASGICGVDTKNNFQKKKYFNRFQKEAKEAGRGKWA